ncbi:phosphotransferase enzyme family protein [Nocardiopsis trehalosi]|jgi:spectinomycin phosphotransferase|uniref:phosphotransferase enzyme family protein n=1 Tax=Nocardiopsis trehalosi TaxID=109329 RepID=UPI0008345C1D|nr:phosphotransferase [Nocardiopsis trehalosi]
MPDERRISGWLRDDFGLDVRHVVPVGGGADVRAAVFRATTVDGADLAVKWTTGGSPAGLAVPAFLAASGIEGAPAPVPTRAGGWWSEREGARLSAVRWVAGTPALDAPLGPAHWTAYGRLLARLHGGRPGPDVTRWVPRVDYAGDAARWAAGFDAVTARIDRAEAAPGPRALLGAGAGTDPRDPLVNRLLALWARQRPRLAELRDRTDRLAARLAAADSATGCAADSPAPSPADPHVLCHGDPHLGNVIATGPGAVALIDFDDAVLAPPEKDLMFVLGPGVLSFAPVDDRQRAWFLAGYGPVRPDPDRLAYFRCVRALEDAGDLAAQVLDTAAHPAAARAEALGHLEGFCSPAGLLDQALA